MAEIFSCHPQFYFRVHREDFEKKMIPAGESCTFEFEIDPMRDLSYVDWKGDRILEPGDYYIIVKGRKVRLTLE